MALIGEIKNNLLKSTHSLNRIDFRYTDLFAQLLQQLIYWYYQIFIIAKDQWVSKYYISLQHS